MVSKIPNGSMRLSSSDNLRALDRDHRVSIPKEMLKALNWTVTAGSLSVVAEVRPAGRIRLLELSRVEERLGAVRERIQELGGQEEIDQALSALADRYRVVKLYPEGRVHLTAPVHAALDEALRPISVMVELVANRSIEILTLSARNERLFRFNELLDIEE